MTEYQRPPDHLRVRPQDLRWQIKLRDRIPMPIPISAIRQKLPKPRKEALYFRDRIHQTARIKLMATKVRRLRQVFYAFRRHPCRIVIFSHLNEITYRKNGHMPICTEPRRFSDFHFVQHSTMQNANFRSWMRQFMSQTERRDMGLSACRQFGRLGVPSWLELGLSWR